jgi:hypothetical protein
MSLRSSRSHTRFRRTGDSILISRICSKSRGLAYRFPRVCSVVLLLRSLGGHIRIHNTRRLWATGVDSGPAWGIDANGRPGPDIRTHARMRDMQKLHGSFPWASLVDFPIFLEGWDRGAEWTQRNPENGKRQLDSSALRSSTNPDGMDSMLHKLAQQDSTHDLLSQLPSQALRGN